MVVRVAQRAQQSKAARVIVAADDEKIVQACEIHGIEARLTRKDHPTGTDRLAEIVAQLNLPDDHLVVNVQGDEPLVPPELIDEVAQVLANKTEAAISTAALAIDDLDEINSPHAVKVVFDQDGMALYFSRSAIPFIRDTQHPTPIYRHIGMYAYRAGFLKAFSQLSPAPLEQAESLEQLRALWHGYRIAVTLTPLAPPPGVDTPEDLERVRTLLA